MSDRKHSGHSHPRKRGNQIGKIETHHRDRYKKLLEMLEAGTLHKREQPIKWRSEPVLAKPGNVGVSVTLSQGTGYVGLQQNQGTRDMIPLLDNLPVNPKGPNMQDYDEVARTYDLAVPEHFNYGFDVIDRWSEDESRLALVWADRTGREIRKYSFFELKCLSNRFANALIEMGIEKGDPLFVMVPRVVEWYAVMLGCCKLGVIPMPAPNILTPKDVAYRINEAGAVGAVVWNEHVAKVDAIRAKCPPLKHFVSVGGDADGWLSYESLMEGASGRLSREDVKPTRSRDIMLIYFTSGTTSFPKMVPHTQASYGIGHMVTAKFWHDLKPSDLHWTLADTGWAKAAWGKLFGQWLIGATVMVHDASGKFDARVHLELIERCGITTFALRGQGAGIRR